MHAPLPSPRPEPSVPPRLPPPSPRIRAATIVIGLVALAAPALLVRLVPLAVHHPQRHAPPQRVIPPSQIPPVEPIAYEALDPDAARKMNAEVPFTSTPVPAARPFHLLAAPLDRARAVDCLAAAVLYEAGDDATGEQAVAQVVLNRLRHPAFPKTVCGVVFQGAERPTGCQFTFTCDGAMTRHFWTPEAWTRARAIAAAALDGAVYPKVGYATHYHTDWVVPYWSASLDKVAAVGTHLFFRWSGWWGTPGAFQRAVAGGEPAIAELAAFSPVHRADVQLADLLTDDQRQALVNGAIARLPPPVAGDSNSFLVTIDPGLPAQDLARLAVHSCGERPYCKFMAWTSTAQTPKRLPLGTGQVATMAFSYLRDHAHYFDKMLWNCRAYPQTPRQMCMKVQTFIAETPSPPATDTAPPAPVQDNATAP